MGLQEELAALRAQGTRIDTMQTDLAAPEAVLMVSIEAAVVASQTTTKAATQLRDALAVLAARQPVVESSTAAVEVDVNRVEGRTANTANNTAKSRAEIDQVLKTVVHPDTVWAPGSATYTVPEGETPVYAAMQSRLATLTQTVESLEN